VYGHILEDGRQTVESAKYRKAVEKNILKLNEDEILLLLGLSKENDS